MVKIITISGLDGSGKSTQIEFLKKYLESQGKSFWHFHGTKSSISLLYKRLPLFSWKKTKEKTRKNEGITKANWIEVQLRKIALVVDIFRFKRMIKKLKVDYIISDRYFFDSVVNINYLSGKNKYRLAECFIPRPNKAFYLKISPEKIMDRDQKPDQGAEYLEAKEKLYESRIKDWRMIVLDGDKSRENIFSDIRKFLISN